MENLGLIERYITKDSPEKMYFINKNTKDNPDLVRGYQLSYIDSVFHDTYRSDTTYFRAVNATDSYPAYEIVATDVYDAFSDGRPEWAEGRGDGGLASSVKYYVNFLDRFYNGNFLTVEEKKIYDDSFVKDPVDVPSSFGDGKARLGLGTLELTKEVPKNSGLYSVIHSHGGSNYGTRCRNARETRTGATDPITIDVCQNVTGYSAGPEEYDSQGNYIEFAGSTSPGHYNPIVLRDTLIEAIRNYDPNAW